MVGRKIQPKDMSYDLGRLECCYKCRAVCLCVWNVGQLMACVITADNNHWSRFKMDKMRMGTSYIQIPSWYSVVSQLCFDLHSFVDSGARRET